MDGGADGGGVGSDTVAVTARRNRGEDKATPHLPRGAPHTACCDERKREDGASAALGTNAEVEWGAIVACWLETVGEWTT